jgi:hypothetical protein
MKVILSFALLPLFIGGLLQADPAVKFDDLPDGELPVPPGYHGLNWSNLTYIDGVNYGSNPSGFQAGAISPNCVIFGGGGNTGVISAPMFDFISAYATGAWNDNLQLVAKGFIKGTLVYSQTNLLSAASPALVHFNFYGVDEVDITSSGGTLHPGYSGGGSLFVLDNVSVVTYVPYSAPLISYGGFETGTLAGWGANGNTTETFVTNDAAYVHSGRYGVKIGPYGTQGSLSQFVGTLGIGEEYTLSFWLENLQAGVNDFYVNWSPERKLLDLTNQPAFAWTNIQINFLSGSYGEDLVFDFLNDPSYFGFDDISLAPTLLLTNGGFETGDFSGWNRSGNPSYAIVGNGPLVNRSGSFGASFGAIGSLGYISQQVATFPGHPYLVSLWLDSADGKTPNEFSASWNGQYLADMTNLPATGWTNMHFTVPGAGALSTLQLGFRDDPSSLSLDEVSVLPVPILQNGGFEFGDFTGWTTSGNFGFCSVTTNQSYIVAGFYGGQFGPVGTPGYISQVVSTVPGQTYQLAFRLNLPSGQTNTQFSVSWNGETLTDVTNPAPTGWKSHGFFMTQTTTNSTLQFGFRDDSSYMGIDEIAIWAVSPPVIQSITKTAGVVNIAWSSMPGFTYHLQYKTSLAQGEWTDLGSSLDASDMTLSTTDVNPPDAVRYYRVLMYPQINIL